MTVEELRAAISKLTLVSETAIEHVTLYTTESGAPTYDDARIGRMLAAEPVIAKELSTVTDACPVLLDLWEAVGRLAALRNTKASPLDGVDAIEQVVAIHDRGLP